MLSETEEPDKIIYRPHSQWTTVLIQQTRHFPSHKAQYTADSNSDAAKPSHSITESIKISLPRLLGGTHTQITCNDTLPLTIEIRN